MQVEYQAQTAGGLCMVYNTIGRYETASRLRVGSQVSKCCGQGLESDPNGGLLKFATSKLCCN